MKRFSRSCAASSEQLLEDFQKFCDDNSMNASKNSEYSENDVEAGKRPQKQINK
jgi:hypothetical protein